MGGRSFILLGMIGNGTATEEIRDPRPHSVRFQDAAILEYAVRNRLVRGRSMEGNRKDARAEGSRPGERFPRTSRRDPAWTAARAEGIYRNIAPRNQKYPLRAVALVRRMLSKGAPAEFVQEKYQTHVRSCGDIGVTPMPLIPYLTELLEIHRLETNADRRGGTLRECSIP